MRIWAALAFGSCLLASTALADTTRLAGHLQLLGDGSYDFADEKPPKFAFTNDAVHLAPTRFADVRPEPNELGWWRDKLVVAEAADKKSAWISAEVGDQEIGCGAAPCPPEPPKVTGYHITMLIERVGASWEYVAWNVAYPVAANQQIKALKAGKTPPVFARGVAPGAEDAVEMFETTFVDPKALAASVSRRKDVVLYGSAPGERALGGDKVRAKLAAWNLAFKVRDGVQAGVTSSKTVAWVAANVDAVSKKKGKAKAKVTPYRVLVLYEKTGPTWQVVQVHFSFIT